MNYFDPTEYWNYVMETGATLRDILGMNAPANVIEGEFRDVTEEEEKGD